MSSTFFWMIVIQSGIFLLLLAVALYLIYYSNILWAKNADKLFTMFYNGKQYKVLHGEEYYQYLEYAGKKTKKAK